MSMPDIRLALQQAWLKKGLIACVLWPVSLLFSALLRLRKLLYRFGVFHSQRLPVPVIVVGNVFVGGVGKTPLVIALVKQLTATGLKVGVLSRGYGRSGEGSQPVTPQGLAQYVGDEPLLIARACQVPVFVGKNRFEAGRDLLAQNPYVQVIVCDDGMQHLGLQHDLALCVFDERGIGNGWLLPAGPLREGWPLRQEDHAPLITVMTSNSSEKRLQEPQKVEGHEYSQEQVDTRPSAIKETQRQVKTDYKVSRVLANFAQQADGTKEALSSFRGQKVQALAGIGNPEVFFDMLRAQGIALSKTQSLADHDDMRALQIDPDIGAVFCTEKDAVKLWEFQPKAWAVPLVTEIPEELLQAILAFVGPKLSSVHGHQTT